MPLDVDGDMGWSHPAPPTNPVPVPAPAPPAPDPFVGALPIEEPAPSICDYVHGDNICYAIMVAHRRSDAGHGADFCIVRLLPREQDFDVVARGSTKPGGQFNYTIDTSDVIVDADGPIMPLEALLGRARNHGARIRACHAKASEETDTVEGF